MKQHEILKMKAEAHTNHLTAKLNETEADALSAIAKFEEKIISLKDEVKACKTKKDKLKQSFEGLQNAKDDSWDQANQQFIESVESLEDKNVFKFKTDEWFKNIREVSNDLKKELKEKVADW